MNDVNEARRRDAMRSLIEYGEAAAAIADRNERVRAAHAADISKAEIARVTGLSWATVDRIVRGADEEAGQ